MPILIAACVGGIVLLAVGSDHFVLGASRLALALRVRPVLVGAIVIGFGTSAPELVVSALAATQGSLDIALSNITGSNLANVTLVLGFAAVVAPLSTDRATLRREAPIAAAAVILFAGATVGGVQRWEGIALLAGLAGALTMIIRSELVSRREEAEVEQYADVEHEHPPGQETIRTVLGLAGTVAGAQLLVYGARGIAERAGLSEAIIGLTLVAVGTSLPELATVVQAARRNQGELIVGNVLGSNMFNSLAVGGAVALAGPGTVTDPDLLGPATLLMIGSIFLAWALLRSGRRLLRWEGVALLVGYGVAVAVSAA